MSAFVVLSVYMGVILSFLLIRKVSHNQSRGSSKAPRADKIEDGHYTVPPSIASTLPVLGHLVSYIEHGPRYFDKLALATTHSVFSINLFSTRITLIQPELTKFLTRLKNNSLSPLVADMMGPCLDLSRHTLTLLQERDSQSRLFGPALSRLFRQEFIPNARRRIYASSVDRSMRLELERVKDQEVDLEDWLFKSMVGALGDFVCGGVESPYHDEVFLSHLRTFHLSLRALNNPVTWLIDKRLLKSRKYVRDRLEEFTFEKYSQMRQEIEKDPHSLELGLLDRIHELCASYGAPAEGWTDYQLLLIFGIGPNITNATAWLVLHLIHNPELWTAVRREVDALVEINQGSVDCTRIHDTCPTLHATWLEVLRFHVPLSSGRYMHEDAAFANRFLIRRGTYAIAPLKPLHSDPAIWGDDANEFHPERFLLDGKFDHDARKKLRVFGLFGTICPGRFLAEDMAMSFTIRLLSSFNITTSDREWVLPLERKEVVVGLPSPDREVLLRMSKREDAREVNFV
ncbi:cytochrome P450 [Xylariales sp. PMI_506]|nr:cytochrome P450 [Xylariales sp. PMI_506]